MQVHSGRLWRNGWAGRYTRQGSGTLTSHYTRSILPNLRLLLKTTKTLAHFDLLSLWVLKTVYRNARTFDHSRYPLFPLNPGPGTVARPARSATRRPPYYSADRVGSSLFNLILENGWSL